MKRYIRSSRYLTEQQHLKEFQSWLESNLLNRCKFLKFRSGGYHGTPRVDRVDFNKEYDDATGYFAAFSLEVPFSSYEYETVLLLTVYTTEDGTIFYFDAESRFRGLWLNYPGYDVHSSNRSSYFPVIDPKDEINYGIDNLDIPDCNFSKIPVDFDKIVNDLTDFYNWLIDEYNTFKESQSNQEYMIKQIFKDYGGSNKKQKYEMDYRVYGGRGLSGGLKNEKFVSFSAPDDYWALFATKLKKSVNPKNLAKDFTVDELETLVNKYPDFNSLLNSDFIDHYTSPDEYTVIAYMKNLNTGKILFEYDIEETEDEYEEDYE